MLEIVGSHLAKSSNIGYNGPKYLCVRPEAFRVCRDYCSESICDSRYENAGHQGPIVFPQGDSQVILN